MKSVEIIYNGTYSVLIYNVIVFTGTRSECERRVNQE